MAPLGQITEAQVDKTFNLNVRGLIFTVQKALPFMREGGFDNPERLDGVSHGNSRFEYIGRE
jgi:NAD(P)-dependent dehydrogenase (short-subunit alcohol dehydrogenase family)